MSNAAVQRKAVSEQLLLPLSWEQGCAEALGDANHQLRRQWITLGGADYFPINTRRMQGTRLSHVAALIPAPPGSCQESPLTRGHHEPHFAQLKHLSSCKRTSLLLN